MRGDPAPLVVVGDALLDRDVDGHAERLSPDAPAPVVDETGRRARPGGAALAAVLAAREGRAVTLVTALAADAPGAQLRALLEGAGVSVLDVGLPGTTVEKVRIRADGRPLVRLDRGAPGAPGPLTAEARAALAGARGVLVSDYGLGLAAEPALRAALGELDGDVPLVWDPHPRGPAPVPGARVVTPNAAEAARLVPEAEGDGIALACGRAGVLAQRWRAVSVCVTLGPRGAVLAWAEGAPLAVPAPAVAGGDPCGAGDRFAVALAGLLADGQLPSSAVAGAVEAASAFVAAGGAGAVEVAEAAVGEDDPAHAPGAAPSARPSAARARAGADRPPGAAPPPPGDALALARAVRARGGTVVATGGCFDILHPGHVATLAAARSLGDCLVVCLNSDASVQRLKGPERPVNAQADRAAVLEALACVDAVAVFEEDTPVELLRALRPHLFVKGGDYHAADLPETPALAEWGGRAVTVPYVAGRSTTRILQEVAVRGR